MFNTIPRVRWHVLFAVGVLAPAMSTQALAETACEINAPVTSESLVRLALACSPSQKAVAARWQSQQHAVDAAGRLSDPMVMVSTAPATFGNDQLDEGYVAEISLPIPWPGTLSLQKRAAAAEAVVWGARVDEEQAALAHRIRLTFAQWQYHRELLEINAEHQRLWREMVDIIETKYAAGTADKSAVLQAKHEAHLLMEEAIELKAMALRDASTAKRLVGLPSDATLLTAPIEALEPVPLSDAAFAAFLQSVESQPAIQRVSAELDSTAAELALAKKDRYPNFSVMARYNSLWMNEDQRWMVGVGVNLPLDFGKRSSREKSVRAEQAALRYEQQDLVNELREQLVQTYSLWQQGKETYELYQNQLLPLAEQSLETARQAYQSGAGDFLSLLNAQRQTLTTQRRAEMAVRAQFSALADLTAAAGLVWLDDWRTLQGDQAQTGDQGNE